MSNELKEWLEERSAYERDIVTRYPFLRINDCTDDEKFPMIEVDIPDGWHNLFLELCEDIHNVSPEKCDFHMTCVKEKYGLLDCFYCGETEEIKNIINKYTYISHHVCTHCGMPAKYETTGYIESFCENCCKDKEKANLIKPIVPISFAEEWNRYWEKYCRNRSKE